MIKNYLMRLSALLLMLSTAWGLSAQVTATLEITAPASAVGVYNGRAAAFSPAFTSISGDVETFVDGNGLFTGCVASPTTYTGKIVLIDRGVCGFAVKAEAAQAAGAAAVVVCNNNANLPYQAIIMGGTPVMPVTIPAMMLSFNDCVTIKAALAAGPVMGGVAANTAPAAPASICDAATVITPGTYTVDNLQSGFGGVFTGSANAKWYAYTPTTTTLATVSTCGGGVDTWLAILGGVDCVPANLQVIDFNDDCDDTINDFGSTVSFYAEAGTRYWIYFDDRYGASGFDFTLTESALPLVNISMTVDMTYETVDATGVFVQGNFNGGNPVAMTDNLDGTWSTTVSVQSGETMEYLFLNGTTSENGDNLENCGIDDGAGSFVRAVLVNTISDANLGSVCFSSCGDCVPGSCDDPIVLLQDDFDGYMVGKLGPQSTNGYWSTWSGTLGAAEDGDIVTTQAQSGTNSMGITGAAGGGPQDVLLLLGNKTSGRYLLGWSMYVPTGKGGYHNIQHNETPGQEWAFNCNFEVDGSGSLDAGVAAAATFTYPHDEWFDVVHDIDLDNDMITLFIGDQRVYSWPYSYQSFMLTGAKVLGAVDFFPRSATDAYFIDDVVYASLPTTGPAQNCFTAESIAVGTHTVSGFDCIGGAIQPNGAANGAFRGYWYEYTPATDGVMTVSSCDGAADTRVWILEGDCQNYVIKGMNDDMCVQANGDPYASYREVIVKAGETYFIVWDDQWDATGFDWNLSLSTAAPTVRDFCETALDIQPGQHNIDVVNGNACVAGPNAGPFTASTTPYANSEWFQFTPTTSGVINVFSCALTTEDTRVWIYSGTCGDFGSLVLEATDDDGCSLQSLIENHPVVAGTTYYIEWDGESSTAGFDWFLEFAVPTVTVTVQVDMSKVADFGTVDPLGAHVAGPFNGWTPTPMTNSGNNIWTYTINDVPANDRLLYKFQNGPTGWEGSGLTAACAEDDGSGNFNRFVDVDADDVTVDPICFNKCVACALVGTNDQDFASTIKMFPNPASQFATIQYNFTGSKDIKVRLINTLGQIVLDNNYDAVVDGEIRLPLQSVASGMYQVVISDGNTYVSMPLIKE